MPTFVTVPCPLWTMQPLYTYTTTYYASQTPLSDLPSKREDGQVKCCLRPQKGQLALSMTLTFWIHDLAKVLDRSKACK